MLSKARTTLLILCGALLLAGLGAGPVVAYEDACSVREATQRQRSAYRALVRAEARYRKACAVTRATKANTARYGSAVGRWVWLAGRTGWPRSEWGQLCYVIDRESGGDPAVENYQGSGATGLLQLMPMHWAGKFDPKNPRANLSYGYRLWRSSRWSPWAL